MTSFRRHPLTTIEPSRHHRGHLITHLRHIDIAVPDYDAQVAFCTGRWGLTCVGSDTPRHLPGAGGVAGALRAHLLDVSDPMVSDQWGTANQMNEFVARQSFNDEDEGVFVAPAL